MNILKRLVSTSDEEKWASGVEEHNRYLKEHAGVSTMEWFRQISRA